MLEICYSQADIEACSFSIWILTACVATWKLDDGIARQRNVGVLEERCRYVEVEVGRIEVRRLDEGAAILRHKFITV